MGPFWLFVISRTILGPFDELQGREIFLFLVDLWLDVDVSVACFCDGSDAPLHVLSVELELCFGDVVVEFLDGLGIVCALLVGDVLAGEVRRALAFCLVPRDVLAPFEGAFAEAPGAFGGDDGDLAVGLQFAGVYILFDGIVLLFYRIIS